MAYERINWQNEPSEATALNDVNLNKMDSAIYDHDQRLDTAESDIGDIETALDNKVDKESGKGLSTVSAIGVTTYTNQGGTICDFVAIDQSGNAYHNYIKNGVVIDSSLSSMSQNPVENRVVKNALDNKVDKESGKGLSQVDNVSVSSTTSAGTKIGEITVSGVGGSAVGTNLYNGVVVDSALSNESENPVQNKVVKESISDILPTNTATGNPIVINDGMKLPSSECKVTMNPIQDLHGYEYPWVGGAGKNKAFKKISATTIGSTGTVGNSADYYTCVAKVTEGQQYAFSINGEAQTAVRAYYSEEPVSGSTSYNGERYTTGTTFTAPITGYVAIRCQNAWTNYQIEIGSTATAYAPYENICPISGRDSVTVTGMGKNLFNGEIEQGTLSESAPVGTAYNSMKTNNANRCRTVIPFKAIQYPITISVKSGYKFFQVYLDDEDKYLGSFYSWSQTFTLNNPSLKKVGIIIKNDAGTNITPIECADLLQIELGTTSTSYEPYQGETHTHTYDFTVYGGVDDFVSGEGSANMALDDMGTLLWRKGSGYFYSTSLSPVIVKNTPIYCDIFKNATIGDGRIANDANGNLIVVASVYDDLSEADFKTAMTGHQICYSLATPTTITNTPEDISLLKGVNVVSTDGDNLSLKYSGEIQASGGGVDYSTDEQDTGIKWIDGKTIYQKTLTGVMSRGEYEYYFLCVIGTLSNAHLIKSEGVVWNDTNGYQIPINSAGTTNSMPTGDLQTFLYNRAGTLCLTLTQDSTLVGYNYAVTIYYTKA